MKGQTIILLSLMCCSVISQFTQTHQTGTGESLIKLGTEGGQCKIYNHDSTKNFVYTTAAINQCVPKGIFRSGSQVWLVLQITIKTADILQAGNVVAASAYANSLITADNDLDTANTVLIGRIDEGTTNYGKFSWAIYVAGSNEGKTAWSGFEVTETMGCANTIQIKGNVASGFALPNQLRAINAAATGTGAYLVVDTTNTNRYKGLAPNSPRCVKTVIEESEEENEEKSAGILSVASALFALFSVFSF